MYEKLEKLTAKDVMRTDVVTCGREETLSELIGKMKKHDIDEVPVVENSQLIGYVSYEQLIKKRKIPLTTEAWAIMTTPPEIRENDTLLKIGEVMFLNDYTDVPVSRDGMLVGRVSRDDIIKYLLTLKEFGDEPISTIMTPNPTYVKEEDNVEKARHIMRDIDEKSVPVVNEIGRLVGVVGMKEVIKVLGTPRHKERPGEITGEKEPVDIPVRDVMVPAITVPHHAPIISAIGTMVEHNIKSIMVEDDRKPVGIVTYSDIIELLASKKERDGVYVQITGMREEDPDVYNAIYALIDKSMKKINKILRPTMFNIHVVQYHKKGLVNKYSLRARLNTERGLFLASTYDWDIIKAVSELLESLEAQIRKDRERHKDKPKQRISMIQRYGRRMGRSR